MKIYIDLIIFQDTVIMSLILFVFNKLFPIKKREKQEVVTAFSGLLELSRRNKVETSQEEIFGDITDKEKKYHALEYFWSVQGFCTLYDDQEDRIQIHFPFMNVRQPGDDKCVTQAAVFHFL